MKWNGVVCYGCGNNTYVVVVTIRMWLLMTCDEFKQYFEEVDRIRIELFYRCSICGWALSQKKILQFSVLNGLKVVEKMFQRAIYKAYVKAYASAPPLVVIMKTAMHFKTLAMTIMAVLHCICNHFSMKTRLLGTNTHNNCGFQVSDKTIINRYFKRNVCGIT